MFQGHICNIACSRGISAISGFVRGIFAKTPSFYYYHKNVLPAALYGTHHVRGRCKIAPHNGSFAVLFTKQENEYPLIGQVNEGESDDKHINHMCKDFFEKVVAEIYLCINLWDSCRQCACTLVVGDRMRRLPDTQQML
jgi:hypothetical protein